MFDLNQLVQKYEGKNFELHRRYMNPQMPAVLHTLGFDKCYKGVEGAWIGDLEGNRYLDLLSGYGVFNIGRNHPTVKKAILDCMESDIPNMVHFECALLSGILAEKLVSLFPESLDSVFFCNSGAESVEGAIKFARRFTGRTKLLRCSHAFHGLTNGALSLNGGEQFRAPFEPLLEVEEIPYNNLEELEKKLSTQSFAAFFVEPVQGKGVYIGTKEFFQGAKELCDKYGTLLVCDEVQTGFGRTGKIFAFEHFDMVPHMVCVAKALSGGYIPVGAVIMEKRILEATFDSMDNCMIHSSTFSQNNLAMAAGLATLAVLEEEQLVERAEKMGRIFLEKMKVFESKYEMVKEVRGLGLMLGIEFGPPQSASLKMGWKMLHTTDGLFGQLIVIPLMRDHGILTQVAGHNDIIKLLPPLTITEKDIDYVVQAFDQVLKEAHSFPGSLWSMGKTLASLGKKAIASKLKK
ncbi:MAG: aspartate aminotransferase family protein [Planctomycetota bacterium]|nr:MAG: aspartate aminotransferase family protein [Planctomycetota bacterium]